MKKIFFIICCTLLFSCVECPTYKTVDGRFVMEGKLVPGIYGYEYHETYGSLKVIKHPTKIKLPNGSIEKLIGKKITWKDEPVKIK